MGVSGAVATTREQEEEQFLIQRAQMADRAAWDEIFQVNYHRVYAFVFTRVGDREAAEDIAADVFVEAWKSIQRFTYRGIPLISWLFQIAHNLMSDFLRKRSKLRTETLADDGADIADPRDEAQSVAEWQSVSAAFKKLTAEQQQVLFNRFVEGLSLAETATAMGKGENAIKALEFRALKSVRRILGGGAVAQEVVR